MDIRETWKSIKPRYPIMTLSRTWDPTKFYTKKIALENLEKDEFIFKTVAKIAFKFAESDLG